MAGGKLGTTNSSYYLYTNQYYWSGSPDYFFNRNGSTAPAGTRGFSVYSSGDFAAGIVINSFGARPVISLSSKAKLSGSGTYNNVYTVKWKNCKFLFLQFLFYLLSSFSFLFIL